MQECNEAEDENGDCGKGLHHILICKNLHFFLQKESGEIVKVIGHCQGKTSVCHPRSL